jgi:hypothetical protein
MTTNITDSKAARFTLFVITALLFTLLHSDKFFFWDSISQISIPANWYYDHNFRYFFVPDEYATGHPTFVGIYIALLWKVFGRSLVVTHLAMLPFITGIMIQLYSYIKSSGSNKLFPFLIFIIVICDATLVSQMSMITFDIPQIFFFLWSLNCLRNERYLKLSIAFTGLMMMSLRGSICGFGIILYSLLTVYQKNRRVSVKSLIPFLPGLFALILFLLLFYLQKHWIINNNVSKKWEEFSKIASLPEMIRNIGLVAWRLVDYGRIGIWLAFSVILFLSLRKRTLFDNFFRNTFCIAICQFIVLFPVTIPYKNPFGHRYFLPVIIMVSVAVIYWIFKYAKLKILIYTALFILVFSGYFWIYPDKIAQGWDATPAHWPYYQIRLEMQEYLNKNQIPACETGSYSPNIASYKFIDLIESNQALKDADLQKEKFILFSNVYNRKDDVIDTLFSGKSWIKEKIIKKKGVYMILFKRREFK